MPKMLVPVVREARVNTPTVNAELLVLRQAIDGLDEALAALLVSRICLSHQAQALKAHPPQHGLVPPIRAAFRGAHSGR